MLVVNKKVTLAEDRPKKRIMVVDDNPSVREMLTRVLVGEGYSVVSASDGAQALQVAAVTQIDLVLLDLNMPVRNGWDTFEGLTAENPLLSVIIITARPNQLFTVLSAGAGALLEKPLDFPQLLQTIRKLLAETPDIRLARLAGQGVEFQYLAAPQDGEPNP
jgi:two-component system response regulator MprA